MMQTPQQLRDERDEAKKALEKAQANTSKLIELCGLYNTAIWQYSRGAKPNRDVLDLIQKHRNELGIGNGVLKNES